MTTAMSFGYEQFYFLYQEEPVSCQQTFPFPLVDTTELVEFWTRKEQQSFSFCHATFSMLHVYYSWKGVGSVKVLS